MSQSNKLLSLESLRGIAALSVVFYHFNTGSHFNNSFVLNAWLMVDFFFVLSGFVIALNYQRKIHTFSDFKVFQYKRFLRLYPLHIIMLMAFVGIEVAKYLTEIKLDFVGAERAFSKNNFIAFIANVGLLQNWTIPSLTFNSPSWSISAEFYTYAVFGLVVMGLRNSKALVIITSVILAIIAGLLLNSVGMEVGNNTISGPTRCIYSFFLGVITFNLFDTLKLKGRFSTSYLSIGLLAISVIFVILFGGENTGIVILAPILFSVTVLAIASTQNSTLIAGILHNPNLVYLGTISYGIYMIHFAVWRVFTILLRFAFGFPTKTDLEGNVTIVYSNVYIADLVSVFGVGLIILLAHLSYAHVEQRFYSKG
jgi:peptidoglycan/LPS O-acetylase OafA/YrhL